MIMVSLNILSFTQEKIINVKEPNINPVIDGDTIDWTGNWNEIKWPYFSSTTNAMSARFKTVSTLDTIYFIFDISDTTPNNPYTEAVYRNDCITLLLSMDSIRILFKYDIDTSIFMAQRNNSSLYPSNEKIRNSIKIKSVSDNNRYFMEWALPYNIINSYKTNPKDGDKIAFNVRVCDNTGIIENPYSDGLTQINYWYPDGDMSSGFIFCGYLKLDLNNENSLFSTKAISKRIYINSTNEIILDKNYQNISVFDVNGRELIKDKQVNKVQINNLQKGIYFVRLNQKEIVKIIRK